MRDRHYLQDGALAMRMTSLRAFVGGIDAGNGRSVPLRSVHPAMVRRKADDSDPLPTERDATRLLFLECTEASIRWAKIEKHCT